MHINTASSYVKNVISAETGRRKKDVRHRHDLTAEYGYDGPAKRRLAPKIEKEFRQQGDPIPGGLHPSETGVDKTIGDLVKTAHSKFD